jgi:hypothetical protein
MNNHPKAVRLPASPGLRSLFAATAVLAASFRAGAAPDDLKTYSLFQGTDLSVGTKGDLHPVWDVSGGAWVVRIGGQPVVVSAKDGPVGMKIAVGLKLTDTSGTISNLRAVGAYTPQNDPYTKFTKQMSEAAANYAEDQAAMNAANSLMDQATGLAEQVAATNPGGPPVGSPGASANNFASAGVAQQAMITATNRVNEANAATGAMPGIAVGAKTVFDPDGERYDAMDVRFDVSSVKPLEQPYIVLIGKFHDRNAAAGTLQNWIYAQALERVDSSARTIHILRGGLPPAYQMKEFSVHLYDNGREVATNLSTKVQAFTRDEAFDYIKSRYLSSHKGATLPAAPALGDFPDDLKARIAQGQFGQPLYLKISSDGIPTGAFADALCSRPVDDPYVETILRGLRYKPALDNGTPVEGVATLNLGRLAI